MSFPTYLFTDLNPKSAISLVAGVFLGYVVGQLFVKKLGKHSEGESKSEPSLELENNGTKATYTVALVVNSSLKMGKGKVAAQCGHAILSLTLKAEKRAKESLHKWVEEGRDIRMVAVKSTEDFDDLGDIAEMESLQHYVVADAGLTQIKRGSLTVMAIGPARCDVIDNIVGKLPLYL